MHATIKYHFNDYYLVKNLVVLKLLLLSLIIMTMHCYMLRSQSYLRFIRSWVDTNKLKEHFLGLILL